VIQVRLLLAGVVALLVGAAIFLVVRARVRRMPSLRFRIVLFGCLAIALAGGLGWWLPSKVPDTPGSPAALIIVGFLWFLAAAFLLVGVSSLLGAAFAWTPRGARR
jgi:hypothetical protein